MISNPRHGWPPRLMPHQPTRCSTTLESSTRVHRPDPVLRVDHKRWGRRPEDLRNLAVKAPHARSRERFLALYEITQGSNATRVATRIGRHPHNVMEWVHRYNAGGPDAISYRRTGGRVA